MRLPDDVVREVFPWEEFVLARSLVDTGRPDGEYEDDLFAGIRTAATWRCSLSSSIAAGKKEQARCYATLDDDRVIGTDEGPAADAGRHHVHAHAGRRRTPCGPARSTCRSGSCVDR